MTTHNKKRNAGLLFEFLVQTISRSLVDGDERRSNAALKLLKKHFKQGTELYREFRLINSLVKTTVSSTVVAGSILNEARKSSNDYNLKKINREKSILIDVINKTLNEDGDFFNQSISQYKTYATIQTLINEWRKPKNRDIELIASYEDQLVNWLIEEKSHSLQVVPDEESRGTHKIVMKLMTEKINQKYGEKLTSKQKNLLKEYVFSNNNQNFDKLKNVMKVLQSELSSNIKYYQVINESDEFMKSKLSEVLEIVESEIINEVNDEIISRYMSYIKLNDELSSSDLTGRCEK